MRKSRCCRSFLIPRRPSRRHSRNNTTPMLNRKITLIIGCRYCCVGAPSHPSRINFAKSATLVKSPSRCIAVATTVECVDKSFATNVRRIISRGMMQPKPELAVSVTSNSDKASWRIGKLKKEELHRSDTLTSLISLRLLERIARGRSQALRRNNRRPSSPRCLRWMELFAYLRRQNLATAMSVTFRVVPPSIWNLSSTYWSGQRRTSGRTKRLSGRGLLCNLFAKSSLLLTLMFVLETASTSDHT
jgi:hypothetical protein